jgi:hypothetical protein
MIRFAFLVHSGRVARVEKEKPVRRLLWFREDWW